MQIEYFVTVLSGKTFRFILGLYQGIWKIGHEFGCLSLRSPARASPFQGIYFDSLRVETHSPQNQNQQTHRSLFLTSNFQTVDAFLNIGFHNALGRGSTRKWSIDEFTESQGECSPWDVLLAKYGNNLVASSMFAISNSLVQLEHVTARLQALISVAANELISVWHTLCQENGANLWMHCGFQLAGSATFVQQFSRSFTHTIYTFIGFFQGFFRLHLGF